MLKGNLKCVRMIVLLYMERIDMLIVFILMGAFFVLWRFLQEKDRKRKVVYGFALFVIVVTIICYVTITNKIDRMM